MSFERMLSVAAFPLAVPCARTNEPVIVNRSSEWLHDDWGRRLKLAKSGMASLTPLRPLARMLAGKPWWPHEFGDASVSGSSNGVRYAYFGDKRRLVVDDGHTVRVYDTGASPISGFSSTNGKDLTFRVGGEVRKLRSLKLLPADR